LSDPDRWDNLAGGMIAAGEADHEALAREAYEEGGLKLAQLPIERGSRFRVQRMVAEGLMIETVQVFDVRLPADFVPANLDGEVAGFEFLPVGAAVDAIERGDFTLQASMAILDALRRDSSPSRLGATTRT
jgi:8-oxo-dGTP pyrophosphatase MutT (NUDIX family)